MATPFLAELRLFSFNFPPKNWAFCNGQLLPIQQNQALFSLLGTTYGGNGVTNFALPDLRGRVPLHYGAAFALGEKAGEESHTISINEMPAHNHLASGVTSAPNQGSPLNGTWAATAGTYSDQTPTATMHPASIANAGGSQPHTNLSPYLVVNFCIALQGVFPSQN